MRRPQSEHLSTIGAWEARLPADSGDDDRDDDNKEYDTEDAAEGDQNNFLTGGETKALSNIHTPVGRWRLSHAFTGELSAFTVIWFKVWPETLLFPRG